jgi:hypothetical protein
MSKWICEDVGLFINQQRDKLSEKLNEYTEKEGEVMDDRIEGIIVGLNLAYDILDELADNWTSEDPPAEVLNKLKDKYGEDFI